MNNCFPVPVTGYVKDTLTFAQFLIKNPDLTEEVDFFETLFHATNQTKQKNNYNLNLMVQKNNPLKDVPHPKTCYSDFLARLIYLSLRQIICWFKQHTPV